MLLYFVLARETKSTKLRREPIFLPALDAQIRIRFEDSTGGRVGLRTITDEQESED
jgi:hypothetical protein